MQFLILTHATDPDDSIFVRAPPRIGQRYQATIVPEKPESQLNDAEIRERALSQSSERGTDATVERLSNINHRDDDYSQYPIFWTYVTEVNS